MNPTQPLVQRWGLYVDVEGFAATYENGPQALQSLDALANTIFKIGTRCFPESPSRMFAHQLGDGFVIVGEFGERSLERPISIAIALLRAVLAVGGTAKAFLAEGDFADVRSCLSEPLVGALSDGNSVQLGHGVLNVLPVMGTALIRAVAVAKCAPSGSLLTLPFELGGRLPQSLKTQQLPDRDLIAVDWIHSQTEMLAELERSAELAQLDAQHWEQKLLRYIRENRVKTEWASNTIVLLDL